MPVDDVDETGTRPIGFVGLGNMGSELARNLVVAGHAVATFDLAGPDRNPDGASFVDAIEDLASAASIVVLSLPDGRASEAVCRAILASPERRTTHVVDTSTVGPAASDAIASALAAAGVGYVDAPVSGGAAGARARTLVVMYAGNAADVEAVQPVLDGLSDRHFRIGDRPGMAQAMKLANNFLAATALAATSEAVAFATGAGIAMETVLEVLNVSSGQSAASRDKFVQQVLPGRYDSGFLNTLMHKDVDLYLRAATAAGSPVEVGEVTAAIWSRFAGELPDADFTRIYPFVAGET